VVSRNAQHVLHSTREPRGEKNWCSF
jgi:hypothetical protein